MPFRWVTTVLVLGAVACQDAGTPAEPFCGDGALNSGELCDDGNGIEADACTNACKPAACGDGILGDLVGEGCDDGNTVDDDGCESTCQTKCGDGIQAGSEACDDANDDDLDACRNDCTLPTCGDGVMSEEDGEECDDGENNGLFSACLPDCQDNVCGDGWLSRGVEACETNGSPPRNTICDGTTCQYTCLAGFDDCDGVRTATNGCEADLAAPATCGSCERTCSHEASCLNASFCAFERWSGAAISGLSAVAGTFALADRDGLLLDTGTFARSFTADTDLGWALSADQVTFALDGRLLRGTQTGTTSFGVATDLIHIGGQDAVVLVYAEPSAFRLVRLDATGRKLHEAHIPEPVELAHDGTRTFVATPTGVLEVSATGTATVTPQPATFLTADEAGVCFIESHKVVCRDVNGLRHELRDASEIRALDAQNGTLWGLLGDSLVTFDRTTGATTEHAKGVSFVERLAVGTAPYLASSSAVLELDSP